MPVNENRRARLQAATQIFLSFLISVTIYTYICGLDFVSGTSDYWNNPRGIISGSAADMPLALSAYYAFVHDAWHWPLFKTYNLGIPGGSNILLFDCVPIVSLAGKIAYHLTGRLINLYGLWTLGCLALFPVSCVALIASLRSISYPRVLLITLLTAFIPPLLWRWGHIGLMAQFEIVLALIAYVGLRRSAAAGWSIVGCNVVLALSFLTHPYLFLMVAGIVAAGLYQVRVDGACSARRLIAGIAAFAASVIVTAYVSGVGSEAAPLAVEGFGFYSTNLLSPFVPQMSAVVPASPANLVDATGGQYEGMAYLGLGLWIMIFYAAARTSRAKLAALWKRHSVLILLLGLFWLVALSNHVFAGPVSLAEIPLNQGFQALFGIVRASGRFVWPVLYAVAAFAIADLVRSRDKVGLSVLALAAAVQIYDTSPLRAAFAASIHHVTPVAEIDVPSWRQAILEHQAVVPVPDPICIRSHDAKMWWSLLDIQLLTAREGVPLAGVMSARSKGDCSHPPEFPHTPAPGDRKLYVYYASGQPFPAAEDPASSGCQWSASTVVCAGDLERNSPRLVGSTGAPG